jgi:predicted PhzF superfamily epimerase YddE/YHI9
MAALHVLRVFTAPDGSHGNPLGVFLEGDEVAAELRQDVARDLGFAETVFVDDAERGAIRIFAPEQEMPFAGHPTVGAAWLLRAERGAVTALRTPAGEIKVTYEPGLTWVEASPEWSPPFEYVELASPAEVDALDGPPAGLTLAYCWAWEDEPAGRARARSFVLDAGIPEDEATGSAALTLAARLGRAIEVRQGRGSVLCARPVADGRAEVGGRVVLDELRDYTVESR